MAILWGFLLLKRKVSLRILNLSFQKICDFYYDISELRKREFFDVVVILIYELTTLYHVKKKREFHQVLYSLLLVEGITEILEVLNPEIQ